MNKQKPATNNKLIRSISDAMRPEEYAETLQKYSVCDFIDPKEIPYQALIEAAQDRIGLFDQYSSVLLNFVTKISNEDENIINIVQSKLAVGRTIVYNRDLKNIIFHYIDVVKNDETKADKVSVLPLICGSGKSTALTMRTINTIIRIESAQSDAKEIREGRITDQFLEIAKQIDGELFDAKNYTNVDESKFAGMLIVTDSKERLHKIWNPDPQNEHIDDSLRQFIEDHKEKWVSIMTEDNSDEEERKQRYSPILCITTQRYFGWTKKEIQKHLEWEDENGVHKRPLIIFDEQPYLNEVRDISVKTINDIDTALRTCLDDECDTEKKRWCCDQWTLFRDWFFALLLHYEYDFIGADDKKLDTLYCPPQGHDITEDDDKFFAFIEGNRKKIRAKDNESYNNLYTVRQWMNSWSIFSHRDYKTGEYSNKFLVYVDNRDKVTDLGAKVVVLDGTGNISPIYMGQEDYVDICGGTNFLRSLSYLTIYLGDLDTSKEAFRKQEIDIAKTVLAYLKKQGYEKEKTVFFTYKGKESKFQARVNGKPIPNVAHFGDIRGKNDFTSETAFAQIGINRMQPVQYLVHVLARHEDMREDLAGREPESMYEQIQAIYQDDRYIEFMTAHVLADIDQCMFRSAIRNADNLDNVVYYIFYKQSRYPALREAIERRYQEELGAHVEPIKQNDILDAVDAGKKAWWIRRWVEQWDGKAIKQSDLLKNELKMNRNTFNTAKHRDPELAFWFKCFSENAKAMGYKGRETWYVKTCVQN